MYIDNLYTKLYSNKDWNGLEQLVSEIRKFSRISDKKFKEYIRTIDPDLRKAAKEDYDKEVHKIAQIYNDARPVNVAKRKRDQGATSNEAIDTYKRQKRSVYKDAFDEDGRYRLNPHKEALNKVKAKVDALNNMRNWKDIEINNYDKKSTKDFIPIDYDGVELNEIPSYDEEGW